MWKAWRQQAVALVFGMSLIPAMALGQATLLPNAKQQYLDDSGAPVANGTVTYYVPSTSTKKDVWLDAAQGTLSTNPVLLDAAGRPQPTGQTYGSGTYRQKVVDQNSVTVWDAVTTSTGGSGGGAVAFSEGVMVGTIIPWANTTLPGKYLYTAGQAISRTTYSDLLTAITYQTVVLCQSGIATISVSTTISDSIPIGAPIEASCFAPGTTVSSKVSGQLTMSNNATATTSVNAVLFPWGNGNGSTTFNVPDLRGRTLVGRNNMGGTPSTVLTSTWYLNSAGTGVNPDAINALAGRQDRTTTLAQVPTGITSSGNNTISIGDASFNIPTTAGGINNSALAGGSGGTNAPITPSWNNTPFSFSKVNAIAVTSNNTGGAAHSMIAPSVTSDYIIKVLPDDSPTGPGVTSIQSMTGAITCGTNVTCTAQTISVILPPLLNIAYTNVANTFTAGPQTIAPPVGTTTQALVVNQTGPSSGTPAGPILMNKISGSYAGGTTGTGKTYNLDNGSIVGLMNQWTVGGTNYNATGEFYGAVDQVNVLTTGGTTIENIARSLQAYANVTSSAFLWGGTSAAITDSGGVLANMGGFAVEAGVWGTGSLTNRYGLVIYNTGSATATSAIDYAINVATIGTNGTSGGAFKKLMNISGVGGLSLQATGDMFFADTAFTIGNVFNLPNATVTGNILNFPKVVVTGDGHVAIGTSTAPTSTSIMNVTAASSGNVVTIASPNNTTGADGIQAGDSLSGAVVFVGVGEAANTGTFLGLTQASATIFKSVSGSGGILFGTLTSTPIVFGTNNTARMSIGASGNVTIGSASSTAFGVGPNGLTNPSLNVDTSTASAATGLNIKSAAAGGGLALSVISSGSNENLTINALGTGTIGIGSVSTGVVTITSAGVAPTGTGAYVRASNPTLTTPVLGAATATSINGLIVTTTAGTLTIPNNASAVLQQTGNFTLNLTVTAASTPTFPTGAGTLAYIAGTNSWSGINSFTNATSASSKTTGAVVATGGISTSDFFVGNGLDVTANSSGIGTGGQVAGTISLTQANNTSGGILANCYGSSGTNCINTYVAQFARGTFASKTQVQADDYIFAFGAKAYTNSSAYGTAACAQFNLNAAEAQTSSAQGMYIEFYSCATGATSLTKVARFGAGGSITFDNIANSSQTSALCYNSSTKLVTYNSGVTTCLASTAAVKDLIAPITPEEGLRVVSAMQPWSYRHNKDNLAEGEQVGLVAQFVRNVDPRLAAANDNGVRYEQYTAMLTAAIQGLQIEIAELKKKAAR